MSTSTGDHPPFCPDPSAHERQHKLSEHASAAALLATQADRGGQTASSSGRQSVLGPDGKLSSSSAATSLKYAKPQDLPSFPSHGLDASSAGAAALLAKDYKMKELWYPEMSAAGSKAAAKAHKDGGKVDLWQPSASAAGNSAAVLAMRNTTLSPQLDRGYTDAGRNNSLLAAAKSHTQGRQRAGSTPTLSPPAYPDSRNSAHNALNAATISHRASTRGSAVPLPSSDGWSSEANQAARVTHIGQHMKPEMFGERPPVEPEVEEQKHNAALRASAVSMAKKMYEYQEEKRHEAEAAEAGAGTAHRRQPSLPTQPDLKKEAMRYIHLQDAAHKLAQERLAKVDQDFEAGRYREYYGYQNHQVKQSRLSMRGRRKRASSEGNKSLEDSDDEDQARRIRQQTSQLTTGLNDVESKKRDDDRARLLAAAEKRVQDRMHTLDQQVFQNTGKVSQSMMDEWEAKARERAEKEREERNKHPGQTHIGGGKFMSQADIEAIAAARLQSTFDEINDTAEKRRARDAEIAREKDLAQTAKMEAKIKDQEQKAEFRRIKDADRAAARKEKDDQKLAKKAEAEAARVRKSEEKRKSREVKAESAAIVAGGVGAADVSDNVQANTAEPTTDLKDQRSSRGSMLRRIASKLKRRDDDDAPAEASVPEDRQVKAVEPITGPTVVDDEVSAIAAPEHTSQEVAVAGSLGALGAGTVVAAAHPESGEALDEDPMDSQPYISVQDETLDAATPAEHTGHYTDALASPGLLVKPDLERHISMIQDSDDDEDDGEREPVSPLAPEEMEHTPMVSASEAAPVVSSAVVAPPHVHASEQPTTASVKQPTAPSVSSEIPPAAPVASAKPIPAAEETTHDKDSKKRNRFFSKLIHRHPKPESSSKATEVPSSNEPLKPLIKEDATIPAPPLEAAIVADPEEPKVSSTLDESRASVSSFRRHDQALEDLDDASSSGADEDDIVRGRTGRTSRLAQKLGFNHKDQVDGKDAAPATMVNTANRPSNDEEQFEEARDHFDEALAPSPAFAGQQKSHSPARETRFQEQL